MKITGLDVIHVHVNEVRGNWTFVRVSTDAGIAGLGESSNVRDPGIVEEALQRIEPLLIGTDPFNIEGLIQTFGQPDHVCFPSHGTALSGIETALWDIKGKALGVPVYELLGGALRDRIRLYANLNRKAGLQPTAEGFAQAAIEAAEEGFTAIKFYPFWGFMDGTTIVDGRFSQDAIDEGLRRLRSVRGAVGPDVDILIQLPVYDMSFAQVVELAEALAAYDPFWFQTTFPTPEDNARFAERTGVPVTSPVRGGFRLGRGHWRQSLELGAMDITNPDLMSVGGLWEMKKIATMAEAWDVGFSPHSPYGPVHTMADVHLCATLPNFVILEYSVSETPWRGDVTTPPEQIKDGYAILPDRPGLGIELNESIVQQHPLGPHPPKDGLDPVWGIRSGERKRRRHT